MIGVSTTKTAKPEPARGNWLRGLPRWCVGLVLIATGTGKALDLSGFVQVLAAYELLPAEGTVLVAYTLPFIELATGLCLITRIALPLAAWVAVGLHLLLLGVVLLTLWRGIAIANCGCFGVFLARPLNSQTVIEDTVMLALSLWVLRQVRW
jgi:hypothetical protein